MFVVSRRAASAVLLIVSTFLAAVSSFIGGDEMPELSDGEDDDCEDEEQWQWMEEDAQTVTCLFCDR